MRDQAVRTRRRGGLFKYQNNSLFVIEQTTSSAALRKGPFSYCRSHSSSAEEESSPASTLTLA
jgi:hypothetical protein